MSEARPVSPPIENLEGKLVGRQRSRYIRKPNAVGKIVRTKSLCLNQGFRDSVMLQLGFDMSRLRFNIKFVIHKRQSNVTHFCKELKSVGIKVSRNGIVSGGSQFSVQLMYITTMALALRVPTWLMIHPNIESIWDSLDLD